MFVIFTIFFGVLFRLKKRLEHGLKSVVQDGVSVLDILGNIRQAIFIIIHYNMCIFLSDCKYILF